VDAIAAHATHEAVPALACSALWDLAADGEHRNTSVLCSGWPRLPRCTADGRAAMVAAGLIGNAANALAATDSFLVVGQACGLLRKLAVDRERPPARLHAA
jgi:hypothetical protein